MDFRRNRLYEPLAPARSARLAVAVGNADLLARSGRHPVRPIVISSGITSKAARALGCKFLRNGGQSASRWMVR
jgi:hypothetical protein